MSDDIKVISLGDSEAQNVKFVVLKVESISKHFGGIKALDNCSIEVDRGKLIALIGPNGSGKSTLFNIISKLCEKDSGKIFINEKEISETLF